jgi:hypothetical protein
MSGSPRISQAPQGLCEVPENVNAHLNNEGVVLLHAGKGLVFTANRMGARIWQGISRRQTVESIAAQIGEEYGLSRSRVLEESQAFVAALRAQGLVKPALTGGPR